MESAQADDQDPFAAMDAEMAARPQPVFKVMRDTMPVMPVEGLGVVLTKRTDVEQVLRHPEIFSSNIDAVDLKNVRPLIPLQIDPPDHKKFRRLLDPIFAPRKVAVLEEKLTQAVNELIDGFIDRDEIDFSKEFSSLYPTRVFLSLLGLPLDELPRFLAMKSGIIRPNVVTGRPYGSQESQELQKQTADSIYEYFNLVLDQRETERQDDLLSAFLDATVDDHKLTREDILDICFLFLIAGLDTVTATLDCMFSYLASHPEQRKEITDDPSIIPTAVEELLRWETPVMGIVRVALEDSEVGGCPVRKDDRVMVMLSSVNTDEADLADADVVRFDRTENRHLAFGGGVHRCLGSNLARLELRVALREWHRRIPEYRVADDHELVYTPSIRSIDYFPMVLSAGS
ncbi:MAG TPA: cytochrome P450 [Acidimicrobiales bacterium]|jgi:cytochrome P450|nr:cytochrome P450 [Acidimicrobiales bacterium]